MNKILFASHGTLAQGLHNTLSIIYGEVNAVFLSAYVEGTDFESDVEQFIESCKKEDYIVLVSDMLGGSVNHCFLKYSLDERVTVVTGLNLPLALLILTYAEEWTKEAIKKICQEAKDSIDVSEIQNREEEDFLGEKYD